MCRVLLGSDYYEDWAPGRGQLGIGRNCVIGPNVVAEGVEEGYIPSGTTIRSPQSGFPHTV